MSDADGVEMLAILGIQRFFDEALRVEVIVVSRHKYVNVSHDLEYIQSLLKCLPGKFNLREQNSVLFHRQVAHFAICLREGRSIKSSQ